MTRIMLLAAMIVSAFAAPVPAMAQALEQPPEQAPEQEPIPKYYFTIEADLDDEERASKQEADLTNDLIASLDIAEVRLDAIGGLAYQLHYTGGDQIGLILLGEDAPQIARDVFGLRAQVSFRLVEAEVSDILPVPEEPDQNADTQILRMADEMRSFVVRKSGAIGGAHITKVTPKIDRQIGQPVILLEFDEEGRERFATLTRDNVGKALAIVMDGAVISAPTINEAIDDGKVQISGGFSRDETLRLAIALQTEPFPVPLTIVEQRRADP